MNRGFEDFYVQTYAFYTQTITFTQMTFLGLLSQPLSVIITFPISCFAVNAIFKEGLLLMLQINIDFTYKAKSCIPVCEHMLCETHVEELTPYMMAEPETHFADVTFECLTGIVTFF